MIRLYKTIFLYKWSNKNLFKYYNRKALETSGVITNENYERLNVGFEFGNTTCWVIRSTDTEMCKMIKWLSRGRGRQDS